MNRVTDTCIPEEEAMRRIERQVLKLWKKADGEKQRYFPYEFMYQLIRGGMISPPEAPGTGLRLNSDALSRFAKALDAEAGPARKPAGSSWLAQAWGRFMAVPVGVAWAAAAVLLALIAVQSLVQPGGKGKDFEIAGAEDDLAKMPFALVKFKPDAKMSDISAFLGNNGMKVIGGPTADGVFRLGIPAANTADYAKQLSLIAAQPFSETVIEGRKPVDGG